MIYTIFGGVNGVGKSTIYHLLEDEEKESLGARINVDELVSSMGSWKNEELQIQAARQTVLNIRHCLKTNMSFNQESTLAGKSIIATVKRAKEEGYTVKLKYIFVDNVEIAKQRVLERVNKGGHGIPEELIEKRFTKSLETLKVIIPLCDTVDIFNNTNNLFRVIAVEQNKLILLEKSTPDFILDVISSIYNI